MSYRVTNITVYGLGAVRLVKYPELGCVEIRFGDACLSIYGEDDRLPEILTQTTEEALAYERAQAMRIATGDKPKAKKA
jgi:hypothetical protein